MKIKTIIFFLNLCGLVLQSTSCLANCNNYSNKIYIPYAFNGYNYNFLQRKFDYNLRLKYLDQHKQNITDSKSTVVSPPTGQNQENLISWKTIVWGNPFSNRIYGGMWAQHLHQKKDHIKNNQLMAFCYNGIYLGTFINSHGDRTYSLGVQRLLSNYKFSRFEIEIGYRLGGMYGYKKYLRLFDTGFFPLFQLVADVNINNFITQISWAWEVFTIGFGYKI